VSDYFSQGMKAAGCVSSASNNVTTVDGLQALLAVIDEIEAQFPQTRDEDPVYYGKVRQALKEKIARARAVPPEAGS
jgi:hypothetical protein